MAVAEAEVADPGLDLVSLGPVQVVAEVAAAGRLALPMAHMAVVVAVQVTAMVAVVAAILVEVVEAVEAVKAVEATAATQPVARAAQAAQALMTRSGAVILVAGVAEAVPLDQAVLEIMVEAMALPALGPAGLVVVVPAALVEAEVEPAAGVVR